MCTTAAHDSVYVIALATTILIGGREADLFTVTDRGLVREAVRTCVRGSGSKPPQEVPDLSTFSVRVEATDTRFEAAVSISFRHVLSPAPVVVDSSGSP